MYFSATNPLFWLFGVITFVSVFISWYLPGILLLKRAEIRDSLTRSLLAMSVGMVLWGIQGYAFGYMHARWLTYIYLFVIAFFSVIDRKYILSSLKEAFIELRSQPKIILIAVVLSTILQLVGHVGSGLLTEKGITFFFINSVDGVMHLSYIQEIVNHFPPNEPGATGLVLKNYHYWGDLVVAELARIWHLPVLHLFFQYLPVVITLVTTLLTTQLIKFLKGTTATVLLMIFFLTFGSDASYIFSYLLHRIFLMDIPVLDNGITFIFNMPQVFARLVLLTVVLLIVNWVKTGRSNLYQLLAIVTSIASLYGFKVYYGMYATLGFGFVTLYILYKDIAANWIAQRFKSFSSVISNNIFLIAAWFVIVALTAAIYLPVNKDAGGLLWYPFEWPKLFLSSPQLNFTNWMLRMQVYEAAHNYRNISILYAVAVAMTLVCVHGTRLVGMLPFKHTFKHYQTELLWFLIPTNILFITIGMLFFQDSPTGGFNIYNFFLVPTYSFCLFAAFNISMIRTKWWQYFIASIIILMTLPRSVALLREFIIHYQKGDKSEIISNEEIELLSYIKNNTEKNAVIQSDPDNDYQLRTPYMSFFSERYSYYGGVGLLDTHNQKTDDRIPVLKEMFDESARPEQIQRYMELAGIDYFVITSPHFIEQYYNQSTSSTAIEIVARNEKGLVIRRNK